MLTHKSASHFCTEQELKIINQTEKDIIYDMTKVFKVLLWIAHAMNWESFTITSTIPLIFFDTILIQIDFLDFPIRPGVEVFEQQNDLAADECAQAPRRTDAYIGKQR